MVKAVFYEVWIEDAPQHVIAFTTKAEAMRAWREAGSNPNQPVMKIRTADLPLRELLVRVFNREGYEAADEGEL